MSPFKVLSSCGSFPGLLCPYIVYTKAGHIWRQIANLFLSIHIVNNLLSITLKHAVVDSSTLSIAFLFDKSNHWQQSFEVLSNQRSRILIIVLLHTYISRGGRKVWLIDLPIPIRSSDFIGWYNRLMSSSDFCIGRLCRFVLSSDSLIVRSCFLVLSSDFCIVRFCRPVLSKKSLYFICW